MKKELIELQALVAACAIKWNNDMYTTVAVLLQNMAFNADNKKWSDFDVDLALLKQFAKYSKQDHVLQWAYSEAQMAIDGHFMSEGMEEYPFTSQKEAEQFDSELTGIN